MKHNERNHPEFFALFDHLKGKSPDYVHSGRWLKRNPNVTYIRRDYPHSSKLAVKLHRTVIAEFTVTPEREVTEVKAAYGGWYTPTTNRWLGYALSEFGIYMSCPLRQLPGGLVFPAEIACAHDPMPAYETVGAKLLVRTRNMTRKYRTIYGSCTAYNGELLSKEIFASTNAVMSFQLSEYSAYARIDGGDTMVMDVYKPSRGLPGLKKAQQDVAAYLQSVCGTDEDAIIEFRAARRADIGARAIEATDVRGLYDNYMKGKIGIEKLALCVPLSLADNDALIIGSPVTHDKLFTAFSPTSLDKLLKEHGYE